MTKFLVLLGVLVSVFLFACASRAAVSTATESVAVQSGGGAAGAREDSFGIGASGMPGPEAAITAESKTFGLSPGAFATPAPAATRAPAAMAAPALADDSGADGPRTPLQTAQRQVISTASISIEVAEVQFASVEVRRIAESLGGFVEQLSISGGSNSQQANITIRVPQDEFFTAVERLKNLGEVQNQNLGSEDVSERFIDLKARLNSSERE